MSDTFRRTYFTTLFEDDDPKLLALFFVELLEVYTSAQTGGASTNDTNIHKFRDSFYGPWSK